VTDGPLIVQSDKTILLDVDHILSDECRRQIASFAELEKSPEHIHTYRLTPLGLWNARAAGLDAEHVIDILLKYSRFAVPHALLVDIAETMSRYGRLRLEAHPVHGLTLVSNDPAVLKEVTRGKKIAPMLGLQIDDETIIVHPGQRGFLKQALLKLGWPAEDFAGYVDGEPMRSHSTKMVGPFVNIKSSLLKVSGTVALVSWSFLVVRVRRSSERLRWRMPKLRL